MVARLTKNVALRPIWVPFFLPAVMQARRGLRAVPMRTHVTPEIPGPEGAPGRPDPVVDPRTHGRRAATR